LVSCLAGCGSGNSSSNSASTTAAKSGPVSSEIDTAPIAPGGPVQSGGVAVRVGPATITKTAFDDRMVIEAHGQSQAGQQPLVPEPPAYQSCITQLAARTAGFGTSSSKQSSPGGLKAQCAHLYEEFRKNVLSELISAEWVIVGAAERGLKVSDNEVRQRFGSLRKAQFPSEQKFREFLTGSGETISDLLFNTKMQLLSEKIRQKIKESVPPVTPAALASYYSANKAKYAVPDERDIGLIRTKHPAAAIQAKREGESGVSFTAIAQRRAHEQTLFTASGLLTAIKRVLPHEKALNDAIFSTKLNAVGGPIRLSLFPGYHRHFHQNPNDINNIDGYYLFKVLAIRPAHTETLTHVTPRLKKELPDLINKKALVAWIAAWRARLRPKTDCSPAYVVRKCRQYAAAKGEAPEDPYTLR
jgi:foldase protein PrsA